MPFPPFHLVTPQLRLHPHFLVVSEQPAHIWPWAQGWGQAAATTARTAQGPGAWSGTARTGRRSLPVTLGGLLFVLVL